MFIAGKTAIPASAQVSPDLRARNKNPVSHLGNTVGCLTMGCRVAASPFYTEGHTGSSLGPGTLAGAAVSLMLV